MGRKLKTCVEHAPGCSPASLRWNTVSTIREICRQDGFMKLRTVRDPVKQVDLEDLFTLSSASLRRPRQELYYIYIYTSYDTYSYDAMTPNCFHDHDWLYNRCLSSPQGHIIENSSKPKYSVLALLLQDYSAIPCTVSPIGCYFLVISFKGEISI